MDRNDINAWPIPKTGVAPLTGSVDRNDRFPVDFAALVFVAPLTGSVDRNIRKIAKECGLDIVAPLTGSVDRNSKRDIRLDG